MLLIPLVLLLFSFAKADNGFCFTINLIGNVNDSWSNTPVDGKLYLTTTNGGDYCLNFQNQNEFEVSIKNGTFKFSQMVASPNESCKFDIKVYSYGYVKYIGELWINENQTNYTLNLHLKPGLKINFITPKEDKVNGIVYINGKVYQTKNGSVEIPLKKDIIWVYTNISGFEKFDNFFNVEYSSSEQKQINVTLYRMPTPKVEFNQSLEKSNLGQKFEVIAKFENPNEESAKVMISGNVVGCGLNKEFSFNLSGGDNKEITYKVNPTEAGNCKITLFYKIQTENQLIENNQIELNHFVSDKYQINYKVENGEIIAEVLDVNGNPVDTDVEIIYNGTKIKLEKGADGKYYGKIPGNEFQLVAGDEKNKGAVAISGNFIKTQEQKKKDHLLGWTIIGILSAVSIGWIYYSRKLK